MYNLQSYCSAVVCILYYSCVVAIHYAQGSVLGRHHEGDDNIAPKKKKSIGELEHATRLLFYWSGLYVESKQNIKNQKPNKEKTSLTHKRVELFLYAVHIFSTRGTASLFCHLTLRPYSTIPYRRQRTGAGCCDASHVITFVITYVWTKKLHLTHQPTDN